MIRHPQGWIHWFMVALEASVKAAPPVFVVIFMGSAASGGEETEMDAVRGHGN
jgi:hypothetical protein